MRVSPASATALLLLLITSLLTARGQPVGDLGILSRRTPARFHLPADFRHGSDTLRVQFFTAMGQLTTNSLTLTNGLMLISDVPAGVDGPVVVEVRVRAADGEESEPRVYKLMVRRRVAPVEGAVTGRLKTEEEMAARSLEELSFVRRRRAALMHPAPAPAGAVAVVPVPPLPPALPKATNQSYAEFIGRVGAAADEGRRRGE